jgi:alkylation response protein AidB-like acyl-CoA dehydrogenase
LMLIEAKSCSDAASMRTTVVLQGDEDVAKEFITHDERKNTFIPLIRTDVATRPLSRAISAFLLPKGRHSFI